MKWRNLLMPKEIVADAAAQTPTFGRFKIEPLERGFGNTIGNALRRTLLSSIQGAAVTAVKIDERPARVQHDQGREGRRDRHRPQPQAAHHQDARRRAEVPPSRRDEEGRGHGGGHHRGSRDRDPEQGPRDRDVHGEDAPQDGYPRRARARLRSVRAAQPRGFRDRAHPDGFEFQPGDCT